MASSGNFCTWNPLNCSSSLKFNTGNLSTDQDTNNWMTMFGTMGVKSGKWYWESYQNANNSNNAFATGIQETEFGNDGSLWTGSGKYIGRGVSTYGYSYAIYTNAPTYSAKRHNDSQTDTDLSAGTSGDIYQLAVDLDNGKIWFGKNNTWADSGDPANGTNEAYSSIPTRTYVPASTTWNSSGSDNFIHNFGQDSTFGGAVTAGSNADGNGYGDFKYSPPSEFLALCTANLPLSENIDPAETSTNYPAKNFNTVLYTGNGSNNHAISGLGFQPDMVWIQRRSGGTSYGNGILDSSRGAGLGLYPDRTDADTTFTSDFDSFDSDGFTVDAGSSMNINNSSSPFVAHCWKANGGTTSSNSEGDITSTVQANTAAGFSIVTYTGDLTSSGVKTVGHGLSKAPDFIIRKSRNTTERWAVSHVGCTSFNEMLELDTTAAEVDKSSNGSMSAPTTTVFSNNYTDGYAVNGTNYIAYCWHNVDGMQKFGYYQGNGSADGPFCYTGGRPALVVTKRIDSTGSWLVHDNKRDTYNPVKEILLWDDSQAEFNGTNDRVDFLSNGFKVRSSNTGINGDGNDYIYMCWMDVPLKYSNTF